MNLFTYGSLMFAEVWQQVVSGNHDSSPATLSGYKRKRVIGESYPAIFQVDYDSTIEGVVYRDISSDDFSLLDAFEGDLYHRSRVVLTLPDDSPLEAEAYILKPEFRHMASNTDWNVEAFASHGIHRFLKRYGGSRRSGRRRN